MLVPAFRRDYLQYKTSFVLAVVSQSLKELYSFSLQANESTVVQKDLNLYPGPLTLTPFYYLFKNFLLPLFRKRSAKVYIHFHLTKFQSNFIFYQPLSPLSLLPLLTTTLRTSYPFFLFGSAKIGRVY